MFKVEKDSSIFSIEGYGHFNIYNISYISELQEYCDGPNIELYFIIDNVKISKIIYEEVNEISFKYLYNEIIYNFHNINKFVKPF